MSESASTGVVTPLYEAAHQEAIADKSAQEGNWVQCQKDYTRAVELRKKVGGDKDGHLGILLHRLGRAYLPTDVDKAMSSFSEAQKVLEAAFYDGHALIAPVLIDQANCLIAQEKYAEAEPLLKRALEINDKTLVNDHRTNLEGLRRLADLNRKLGKPAEAVTLLQKALKFVDTPLGPVEEFRYELALVFIEQKNDVGAAEQLVQAIEGFRYRNSYDRLASAYRVYGELLQRTGKTEESKAAIKSADKFAAMPTTQTSKDIFPATLMR